MRKIIIPFNLSEFTYPDDIRRIIKVLEERGFECDEKTAMELWGRYSDTMAAGWMTLPPDDIDVFGCISSDVLRFADTNPSGMNY